MARKGLDVTKVVFANRECRPETRAFLSRFPDASPGYAVVAAFVREEGGVLASFDGNDDVVWQSNLVASANPTLDRQVSWLLGSD